VNLASKARIKHILLGEASDKGYHGGHMYPGLPNKSVFPANWSRSKIIHNVSDVATDPSLPFLVSERNVNRRIIEGVRDDVKIRVIVDSQKGDLVTGFPVR